MKHYSYALERDYYGKEWPKAARPYRHLDGYLQTWLDPGAAFGGKRILDVGAGEATYTRLIAERYRPEFVVALDLFLERMLPAARVPMERLHFVAGDGFNIPFADGTFDVVFAGAVLCQCPDLDLILAEVRRVLKPGGAYIGWDPNPYSPITLWRWWFTRHSKNYFLFMPRRFMPSFERLGFRVDARYFFGRYPPIRHRFVATSIGIVARRDRASAERPPLPAHLAPGRMREGDVARLATIHMAAYPDALLTLMGPGVVRRYFQALLRDEPNVVGIQVSGEQGEIVGYAIGLLNGDRIARYFWGPRPGLTLIEAALRTLVRPSIWKRAVLQCAGWIRGAIRWIKVALGWVMADTGERGSAMLVDIAVAPVWRQRGLGRLLLTTWEDAARVRGADRVRLMVRADNEPARRLYEHAGWHMTRRTRSLQQQAGFLMMKRLGSGPGHPINVPPGRA